MAIAVRSTTTPYKRRHWKPNYLLVWLLILRERGRGLRLTPHTGIGKLMLAKTEQPLSLNFFPIWRHSPNSSEREG